MKRGFLCDACAPKALPFTDAMIDMSNKLAALRCVTEGGDLSRLAELDRVVADGEKLARSFDAILCDRCRKLGPPCP
jgi:hypothetical protein